MLRSLRLWTGLLLFVFLTLHLANMAFGLVSLKVLDMVQPYFSFLWENPVGSLILTASMLLHLALGFVSLYRRNTLRMPTYDIVQYISAFLVFPLLISHAMGVKVAASMFDFNANYLTVLHVFWVQSPDEGLRQVLLVAVAWIHGCVGLFTWLRLRPWWNGIAPFAYPVAVAVPVLALLGFVEAGNQVIALGPAIPPESFGENAPKFGTAESARLFALYNSIQWTVLTVYGVIFCVVMALRARRLRSAASQIVELHYRFGPTVRTPIGPSLLEIARLNDLPHANICRGRGRCGTCRVRIHSASMNLPPPTELEQRTLDRFDSPEGTRLACQIAPGPGVIELERLLSADVGTRDYRDDGMEEPLPEPSS